MKKLLLYSIPTIICIEFLLAGCNHLSPQKRLGQADEYAEVQVGGHRAEVFCLEMRVERQGNIWLRPAAHLKYSETGECGPDSLTGTAYFDLQGRPFQQWRVVARPNWLVVPQGAAKFVLNGCDSAFPSIYVLEGCVKLYTPADSMTIEGGHGVHETFSGITIYPIKDTSQEVAWVERDLAYHFQHVSIDSVIGLLTYLYDGKKPKPTGLTAPTITGDVKKVGSMGIMLKSFNVLLPDSLKLEFVDSTFRIRYLYNGQKKRPGD